LPPRPSRPPAWVRPLEKWNRSRVPRFGAEGEQGDASTQRPALDKLTPEFTFSSAAKGSRGDWQVPAKPLLCQMQGASTFAPNGGILLSVHSDSSEWTKKAKEILERTGAQDIASTGEASSDQGKSDRPVAREVA